MKVLKILKVNVFEMAGFDVSTKGQISRINGNLRETGEMDLNDRPHSGRPVVAVNEDRVKKHAIYFSLFTIQRTV